MSLCKIDLFFFYSSRSYHNYWFDKARVKVITVKSTRIKLLFFLSRHPVKLSQVDLKKKRKNFSLPIQFKWNANYGTLMSQR